MNWERGLKRLSYIFLVIIWILGIIDAGGDPARIGYSIAGLLFFTLGYMLAFKAVAWAISGFKKDSP